MHMSHLWRVGKLLNLPALLKELSSVTLPEALLATQDCRREHICEMNFRWVCWLTIVSVVLVFGVNALDVEDERSFERERDREREDFLRSADVSLQVIFAHTACGE